MDTDVGSTTVIAGAQKIFEDLAEDVASHVHATRDHVYPQPHTYLTTHLVCMKAAGWTNIDFDTLAAVSGASALFGFQPGTFTPKYALLHIEIDRRIEEATGFGWEWVRFEGTEEAWRILRETIASHRAVKGWYGESILYSGIVEGDDPQERKVLALCDGSDYLDEWWGWQEFCESGIQQGKGSWGRHTEPVAMLAPDTLALRVVRDLVDWAGEHPQEVRHRFPEAAFGLAGIAAYRDACADVDAYPDCRACHDVNPQWAVRNSTARYLERIVAGDVAPPATREAIRKAAGLYKDAYAAWRQFNQLLGPAAPESAGRRPGIRHAAARSIDDALRFETQAIRLLRKALKVW